MSHREINDECTGCGSSLSDREANKPKSNHELITCPFCDSEKCCMCDMGDDVECPSCPVDIDFE